MKLKRRWFVILLMLFPLLSRPVGAGNKFLPVSDIRADMKGTGYTVVSGNKIEPFSVRVIGLLKGSGSVKNLILVKVSGRIFNNGGGISAGMSGSPVFIDNKLIGAIGYGFSNADPTYGLVTPIDDMLRIWSYPESRSLPEKPFVFYEGGLGDYQGVAFGGNTEEESGRPRLGAVEDSWLQAKPVTTPLLVSGLGKRAYDYLYPALAQENLTPIFTGLSIGSRGSRSRKLRLEPGSAVSVTLVDGDYEVKSLGTLTWIEDGRFLAFGHPFLNRGLVEYGFGGAEILDVVTSNVFPFKIGSGYSPEGRVTQDRGAGISGELGSIPEFIEVSVSVREYASARRTKRDHYSFRVIQDEQLSPGLILAGIMDAVDRRLDRVGPGTAKVSFEVQGDNIDTVKRHNLYYGPDIAVASLHELGRLLQLLSGNEFLPVKLAAVSVRMEITPRRLSAKLIKTELPKKEFLPGEEFILRQKLHPYRDEEMEIPLQIKLPSNISPGKWMLSVHGTGYNTLLKKDNGEDEETDIALWETITSMDQLISEFLSKPANNQLVVEAFPLDQKIDETDEDLEEGEFIAPEMHMGESFMFGDNTPESHVWTEDTKYFLTGEDQVFITVLDPDHKDAEDIEDSEEDDEARSRAEKNEAEKIISGQQEQIES